MFKSPNISKLSGTGKLAIETITEDIPASQLGILFDDAQRPIDAKRVNKIVASFKPDLFGHLDVTMPNHEGVCHILDGGHRWSAAVLLFGDNCILPCRVHSIAAHSEAAGVFADLNTLRKGVDELSLFFARRAQGSDDEVRVNTIVGRAGLKIDRSGTGHVACPGALLKVYRERGAEVLSTTLTVLRKAYGHHKSAFTSPMIRGVAIFVDRHPTADLSRLVVRITDSMLADPLVLLRKAQEARQVNNLPNTPSGISFALLKEYNFKARNRLAD